MKKVNIPLLLLVMAFGFSFAAVSQETIQDPNLVYKSLEKKLEKSNADIEHPKKKVKSATWIKRGDMMVDIFNVDQEFLAPGNDPNTVRIYYKEPLEIKTEQKDGKDTEVYLYDRKEVYFQNGKVVDWKILKLATETPLIKAYEAYAKALELDEKGGLAEKLDPKFDVLRVAFEKNGGMAFQRKNFERAKVCFDYMSRIATMKPEGTRFVDTVSIYNAGLAATNSEDFEGAIKFFKKAAEYKYGGPNAYLLIKNAYVQLNDSSQILPLLKEAFGAYPKSKDIVNELINYYLYLEQAEEALEYLKIAKENDPENATYFFAEGTLYDQIGDTEKTVAAYQKAIDLNQDWFDPYYNMGVIYYNNAVEIFDSATNIPPNKPKEYDAAMKNGNDELEVALPFMERALEIAEKDYEGDITDPVFLQTYKTTLETLKNIYFRLRGRSDDYQKKLEKIEAKIKAL